MKQKDFAPACVNGPVRDDGNWKERRRKEVKSVKHRITVIHQYRNCPICIYVVQKLSWNMLTYVAVYHIPALLFHQQNVSL